jgi:hypothetical protein
MDSNVWLCDLNGFDNINNACTILMKKHLGNRPHRRVRSRRRVTGRWIFGTGCGGRNWFRVVSKAGIYFRGTGTSVLLSESQFRYFNSYVQEVMWLIKLYQNNFLWVFFCCNVIYLISCISICNVLIVIYESQNNAWESVNITLLL